MYIHIDVLQSPSCVQFFTTPLTAACQASLSLTISWSLPKFMPIAYLSIYLSIYLSMQRERENENIYITRNWFMILQRLVSPKSALADLQAADLGKSQCSSPKAIRIEPMLQFKSKGCLLHNSPLLRGDMPYILFRVSTD